MSTKSFKRHREQYAKLVTPCTKTQVRRLIGSTRIIDSNCDNFSDIPLSVWDNAAKFTCYSGSLASEVCTLKEAARQIREDTIVGW
jgi:hypothetical protein